MNMTINAKSVEFLEKKAVRHLVKCFRKIQQDDITLAFLFDGVDKISEGRNQLSFTRSFLTKSMLWVTEYSMPFQESVYLAGNNMFHDLAHNRSQ